MRISDWSSDVWSSDLQVDLRGSDDIDVRVGPAFAIQATGPAELLDKLEIVRDGDTLKVGRRGNSVSWGGDKGRANKIMVTMQIGRASCRERVCQYVEIWGGAVA